MRILFFSDNFKPEPAPPATHVYERARLWVEAGHQVTVMCTAPNFPEGKVYVGFQNHWRSIEEVDGIRVIRVKTFISANEGTFLRSIDFASFALSAFCFAWLELPPDIVISTSPQLLAPAAGLAYARLRGIPHIFELRDLWPASLAAVGMKTGPAYRMLERLEMALYRGSARILSFTQAFVEDLVSRGVPRSKVDIVQGGVNLKLFSPRPKDQDLLKALGLDNRFVVGYLGTLGMAHDLEKVLEAASMMADEKVTFLFVGGGANQRNLIASAADRKLNNTIFVERQLKEEMPRYWSICDVALVHLKDRTEFKNVAPSKIFESMGMGLPILYAVPEGEGSEIVTKHGAGICVQPGSPSALVEAVRRLMASPDLMQSLSKGSRDAAQGYSRERQAEACLDVFRKALASKALGG